MAKKSPITTQKDFFKSARDARTAAGIRKRGPQAREWFRNNIIDLFGTHNPKKRENILYGNTQDLVGRDGKKWVGKMYMFFYDPKTKDDMPYYDKFPLIFLLDIYDDGFLGLNLHYLPPDLRLILFEKLITLMTNKSYTDTTRLRISYKIISSVARFKFARPCVKRYLTGHVRSRIKVIPAADWEIALFMPTETFRKQIKEVVWNDSRKIVRQGKQRY